MKSPKRDRRRFSRHKLDEQLLQHNLALAGQIQRSLLPPPYMTLKGIELAGRSTCSTEVGGDYFDYLNGREYNDNRLRIVVGDVSGHGIDAALLMSSARTYIRTRTTLPGKPADIISQMNRQFSTDIGQSGHFMSLFYLDLDLDTGQAEWIRAGHDPAIVVSPARHTVSELRGRGLPLGVDADYNYRVYKLGKLPTGSIIAIGTDGIWEARNRKGKFFGKKAFRDVLVKYADFSARDVVEAVFDTLESYCRGAPLDDDITLVIVKITDPSPLH